LPHLLDGALNQAEAAAAMQAEAEQCLRLTAPISRGEPLAGNVMASGVAAAPGLPPTPAARCVLSAIDGWLPHLLDGALNQAEAAAAMQAEAEQCLRL